MGHTCNNHITSNGWPQSIAQASRYDRWFEDKPLVYAPSSRHSKGGS